MTEQEFWKEEVQEIVEKKDSQDPIMQLAEFFRLHIDKDALRKLDDRARETFVSGAGAILAEVIRQSNPEIAEKIKWEGLLWRILEHLSFSVGFSCRYIVRYLDKESTNEV